MSKATYLDYTCAPNPLAEGKTQDIIVIATLKSANELGIALSSVTITQIVLDFGTVGTGATELTSTALVAANIEVPHNWTSAVSGATCTLTPDSGHGEVSTNAVIVKIKDIAVNSALGNVTLTVREAATPTPQANGELTTTHANSGIENIILPKVTPTQEPVSFSAQPANTTAGDGTTLSWSGGSSSDTFTLLYLIDGQLQTISNHANGTPLRAVDVYPDSDSTLPPPDSALILNSTTTFILQIQKSGGTIVYKTTTVVVSQPNIYAQSVHVSPPLNAATKESILDVQGCARVGDGKSVRQYIKVKALNGNWNIGTDDDGNGNNSNQFYIYDDEHDEYRVTVQNGTGKVGIGTNSPQSTLDVNGDLSVSKTIKIDEGLNVAGKIGVGTDSPQSTLDVKGDLSVSESINANGLNVTGWTTIGNFNSNASSPDGDEDSMGTSVAWNGSGGQMETNFYNLRSNAPRSFQFSQVTGEGTKTDLMTIKSNGHIGIGTTSPQAALHVVGNSIPSSSPGGKYFDGSCTGIANYSSTCGNCIIADDSIQAVRFVASSDVRIKSNIRESNLSQDLNLLLKLQVRNYNYADKIKFGETASKGLIAQELEKLFPQAISHKTDFIPNIFEEVSEFTSSDTDYQLTCTLDKAHDLVVGDLVKLITEEHTELQKEVIKITDKKTFTVKNWTEKADKVFVYGKQVDDFRTVDYQQVAILGISATQALHREVEVLKKENEALKDQLQNEMKSLRAEMLELKTVKN